MLYYSSVRLALNEEGFVPLNGLAVEHHSVEVGLLACLLLSEGWLVRDSRLSSMSGSSAVPLCEWMTLLIPLRIAPTAFLNKL